MSAEETALEELRSRYARGELTDDEFERRLDRLLATKTLKMHNGTMNAATNGLIVGPARMRLTSSNSSERSALVTAFQYSRHNGRMERKPIYGFSATSIVFCGDSLVCGPVVVHCNPY
nr:SHOCT domain-containing protein [Natrialba magadii]